MSWPRRHGRTRWRAAPSPRSITNVTNETSEALESIQMPTLQAEGKRILPPDTTQQPCSIIGREEHAEARTRLESQSWRMRRKGKSALSSRLCLLADLYASGKSRTTRCAPTTKHLIAQPTRLVPNGEVIRARFRAVTLAERSPQEARAEVTQRQKFSDQLQFRDLGRMAAGDRVARASTAPSPHALHSPDGRSTR